MDQPILIAYASKAGSTREVAEFIGQVLRGEGAAVDVYPVHEVRNLESYGALVLGSAARIGAILPKATTFARRFAKQMRQMPVAYFAVCLTMMEPTAENRQVVRGYLNPLIDIAEPVSIGTFAGSFDPTKLEPYLSFVLKDPEMPIGDFRDWDEITAWAKSLFPALVLSSA